MWFCFSSQFKNTASRTNILKTSEWIRLFKTFQVFVIESRYLIQMFLPILFILFTFLPIACHYLLITRPEIIIRARLSLIVISLFSLTAEFIMFYILAKMTTLQEVSIRRRRLELSGKYYRRYLNSLKIETFWIGSLLRVHRILPFTIVHFVIDVTTTFLITLK